LFESPFSTRMAVRKLSMSFWLSILAPPYAKLRYLSDTVFLDSLLSARFFQVPKFLSTSFGGQALIRYQTQFTAILTNLLLIRQL
jgi:hypothetical protein